MLEIERLTVRLGGQAVVRGVSLAVGRGEVVALTGESGSGKSMTALAVMGLLPEGAEASGRVRLDGRDLLGLPERAMNRVRGGRIGMVFQEPMTALNPLQRIGEQVAEAARLHGATRAEARARAAEALARAELPPDGVPPDRYPHELSGGQRQRVGIAIAIAARAPLVIADEPTTALDALTQAGILRLLRRLVDEEAMGLLLITHDLAVVAGIAHRIAVMREGEVVEEGPAARLLAERRHPYTRALFDASAHLPRRAPRPLGGPLLEVEDARREHRVPGPWLAPRRTFRAVDGASLAVREGESVGLVGPSGCGKSTLARAILGLDALQGGSVRLGGEPMTPRAPARLRRRVQAVFQDPYGSLNPRWRAGRIVAEPFHLDRDAPRGEARRRAVAEALDAVGLPADAMDRHPHAFSGGQRQRLAIARALSIRPDLIVLDEAVSALDVRVRARVLDLLADLQGRFGLAYLFISHDLSVVRAVTSRVLVMAAGRIVEEGPTEAVFAEPRHPMTRALLDAAPRLPAAPEAGGRESDETGVHEAGAHETEAGETEAGARPPGRGSVSA